ncbi:MAG: sulfotransferase [Candidatus Limnocylindrales bacterium]
MEPTAHRPIFVVGCPRSGTTLLRMMLDSHPAISCGEETHFLRDLRTLVGDHWPLLTTYGFPREYWLERIRELYERFQADYLARRGKARWAEKDPVYTLYLPFIEELFPDAQYVHLIRDGFDVVASFRERWGYRSAVRVARGDWKRYVSAARDFGRALPEGRYVELHYEALVGSPDPTMRELIDFLGEPWDDAVLRFDEAEHDATERYQGFTARRRVQGGETSAIYGSRVGAGRKALDPVLRRLLERSAGPLLADLGYGT